MSFSPSIRVVTCLGRQLVAGVLLWLMLGSAAAAAEATIFYYQAAEGRLDGRKTYTNALLQLALDKTVDDYGPYEMQEAGRGLNKARLLRELEQGRFSNMFVRASISDDLLQRFTAVPFPLARGLEGYRVAFIRAANDEQEHRFCQVERAALQRLSIVQGIGWLDTKILQENGFSVQPVSSYENMFSMLHKQRADLFFRAVNEIDVELHSVIQAHKVLREEPCLALYYPLPRFFITDKSNRRNAERIYRGLVKAYNDGSFVKLWERNFASAMTQLQGRQIISLDNPFIRQLDPAYQQYNAVIDPYLSSPKTEKALH